MTNCPHLPPFCFATDIMCAPICNETYRNSLLKQTRSQPEFFWGDKNKLCSGNFFVNADDNDGIKCL